jgi:hypothetical protein
MFFERCFVLVESVLQAIVQVVLAHKRISGRVDLREKVLVHLLDLSTIEAVLASRPSRAEQLPHCLGSLQLLQEQVVEETHPKSVLGDLCHYQLYPRRV